MRRSRFVIVDRLSLPRCSGKSPFRSIPLHRTYARAPPCRRAASQAGSFPLPLDCASGILCRAIRIPGEVSGLRRPEPGASGYPLLLEAVHGPEPASGLVEFGRKAVVAQVIVEAYRPSAA